jgi:hypothetical protein
MNQEKPILFSTPMVQSILAGRKTQTRRLIKPQPPNSGECLETPCRDGSYDKNMKWFNYWDWGFPDDADESFTAIPKYQVGDILWVRETHYCFGMFVDVEGEYTKHGKPQRQFHDFTVHYEKDYHYEDSPPDMDEQIHSKRWHKRPSLFMPKDIARIFLEVTDVRVERLQDICMHDAIAEGIEEVAKYNFKDYLGQQSNGFMNPIASFRSLWQSINAKKCPWKSNPWVWVYTFKRIGG